MTHQVTERARDREPEAGTPEAARRHRFGLFEDVEDGIEPMCRDPDASVAHGDAQWLSIRLHLDDDGDHATLGELERVPDEVDEHLLHARRVGVNGSDRIGNVRTQRNGAVAGLPLELRECLADQRIEHDGRQIERHPPRLDLGQVQDVVDQPEEVQPVRRYAVAVGQLLLRHRVLPVLVQHVGESDDRIERRPQLVAHARQEIALRTTGGLGGIAGDDELELRVLPRGDVAKVHDRAGQAALVEHW